MTTTHELPVRDRILETAQRLFYRDGFRAVGIDTIIAEAGVAKMSLYRHFPSKDDLIVAYLEESNQQFWAWLDGASADVEEPAERLVAMFAAIEKLATSPECLGCTFQGTAAEFPDRDHPGHQVALTHKKTVRDRLAHLARQAGLHQPEHLGNQLLVLMDGAWVAARCSDPTTPPPDSPTPLEPLSSLTGNESVESKQVLSILHGVPTVGVGIDTRLTNYGIAISALVQPRLEGFTDDRHSPFRPRRPATRTPATRNTPSTINATQSQPSPNQRLRVAHTR